MTARGSAVDAATSKGAPSTGYCPPQIGNELIEGEEAVDVGLVEADERLVGMLKYYHRRAA